MWDCAESLILLADLRLGYFFCLKWTCCCNIKISMKKKESIVLQSGGGWRFAFGLLYCLLPSDELLILIGFFLLFCFYTEDHHA